MPTRPLIVATGNPGKLREFRALLSDLPFELHGLGELGIAGPEESGATFLENAMLKARHAAAAAHVLRFRGAAPSGVAAIADDSGLEVDALGGAPGIFSARYAGAGADDAANNTQLLSALAGIPPERRRARYRCALVLVFGAEDAAPENVAPEDATPENATPVIAEGVWEGSRLSRHSNCGIISLLQKPRIIDKRTINIIP